MIGFYMVQIYYKYHHYFDLLNDDHVFYYKGLKQFRYMDFVKEYGKKL